MRDRRGKVRGVAEPLSAVDAADHASRRQLAGDHVQADPQLTATRRRRCRFPASSGSTGWSRTCAGREPTSISPGTWRPAGTPQSGSSSARSSRSLVHACHGPAPQRNRGVRQPGADRPVRRSARARRRATSSDTTSDHVFNRYGCSAADDRCQDDRHDAVARRRAESRPRYGRSRTNSRRESMWLANLSGPDIPRIAPGASVGRDGLPASGASDCQRWRGDRYRARSRTSVARSLASPSERAADNRPDRRGAVG
jgi:hypothetical protein